MTGALVYDDAGGELTIPITGFVCIHWTDQGRLVLRDNDRQVGAQIALGPERRPEAQALVERHARVERAVSTYDSELRVSFEGGDTIVVSAHPDVEAWHVSVGNGAELQVIAQPGGGEPITFDAC
jgi:hypothetical protein